MQAEISIHALREEGDVYELLCIYIDVMISIHALREEGDRQLTVAATVLGQFQSTPSARRATAWWRRW